MAGGVFGENFEIRLFLLGIICGKILGKFFVLGTKLGEYLNIKLDVKYFILSVVISKSNVTCEAGCGLTIL